MILFFDTSALVKFFHEEYGSDVVTQLMNSSENEVWLLELVRIEFLSALFRRYRNKEIAEIQLSEAISGFESELKNFRGLKSLCPSRSTRTLAKVWKTTRIENSRCSSLGSL